MNRTTVAFSMQKQPKDAVAEVTSKIKAESNGRIPKLLIFSANTGIFPTVAQLLFDEFPMSVTIGQSSFINFSSEGYDDEGLSVMAIFDDIECASGVLLEVTTYPMRYLSHITNAVNNLSSLNNTCCIEFTTAFGNCEELVQDTFRKALSSVEVPVVGGSSGAGAGEKVTYVSLNGGVYEEACVFVLIRNLRGKIRIFKENLFKPTEHYFTATDVDCDERAVYEYDGQPASQVIANALHVPVVQLKQFLEMHPVGRIEGDQIYITDVDDVSPDGKITYFSRIYNHTQVVQLEVDDMDMVWDLTANEIHRLMENISFSLVVNCLTRSRYFVSGGRFEDFNSRLKNEYGDFIGVSGYGEQMNYEHLNQTMLIACFE